VDFRRSKTLCQSFCIEEEEMETVQNYKYLGVVLDNKLERSANIDTVYRMSAVTCFITLSLRVHCCMLLSAVGDALKTKTVGAWIIW